jgi:hypothetical protein
MKVLSWTGIFRRLASIQTVRDLVRVPFTTYQIMWHYFRLGCKYFYCPYLLSLYILPLLSGQNFCGN